MTKRTPGPTDHKGRVTRFIYSVAFAFYALVCLPTFIWKMRGKERWASRFGFVPDDVRQRLAGKDVLWVHGVSVGEVGQAIRFIDSLGKRLTTAAFVLTTTTVTGYAVAKSMLQGRAELLYFPADFRAVLKRFIDALRPKAVIVLETEIWPNLIEELNLRAIPLMLINGRLSDRSFPKYRWAARLLKPTWDKVQWIAVQDERMRERFQKVGVPQHRLRVTGSMKYDWVPPAEIPSSVVSLRNYFGARRPFVFVAGSTHEGEEEAILRVYGQLVISRSDVCLVLAPRHPDRVGRVEAIARKFNLQTERLSSIAAGIKKIGPAPYPVIVVDTVGILGSLYGEADCVFVGGSLFKYGGHNPVEPAYYGKPILFGPHMDDFRPMVEEFLRVKGAWEVSDEAALHKAWNDLMKDQRTRESLGQAACNLVRQHQGATERNAQQVAEFICDKASEVLR